MNNIDDNDKQEAPDNGDILPVNITDEEDAEENSETFGRPVLDLDANSGYDLDALNEVFERGAKQRKNRTSNNIENLSSDDPEIERIFTPGPTITPVGSAAAINIDEPVIDDSGVSALEQQAAGDAQLIAELRAELAKEKNNTLRAIADLHNFRKRTDTERSKLTLSANQRLIKDLLPIVDDFQRSLTSAKQTQSYEQLVDGVEAVVRKIGDTLAKEGVLPIPSIGERFDPDVHEAVMVEEGSDQPDETVIDEFRTGYTMHGRVLRPAMVKVAKS